MIRVTDLHAYYGHVAALRGVNLEVKKGEIAAILGPNGAGKTTLLRAVSGLKPPKVKGKIFLDGVEITGRSPEAIRRQGIACLIEGKRVFPGLTVKDNLMLGGYIIRKDRKKLKENMELVFEMFPVLKEKLEHRAGLLSGGEQQMLAISRALMGSPCVICLDEPSLGLAPQVVEKIFEAVRELNKSKGITFIVVEQDAALALKYSNRAFLFASGRIELEGSSDELMKDNLLINIYLGGQHR
jgi:branched-chain amino acid transport system ATP-binding protein